MISKGPVSYQCIAPSGKRLMALDIGCCALWHKAPILSGPKSGSWILHGFSTKQLLFCGHGQADHTGLRVVWQMRLLV